MVKDSLKIAFDEVRFAVSEYEALLEKLISGVLGPAPSTIRAASNKLDTLRTALKLVVEDMRQKCLETGVLEA